MLQAASEINEYFSLISTEKCIYKMLEIQAYLIIFGLHF